MADLEPVTTESFEANVLSSSRPVLVDFSATWCAPCKALLPALCDIAAAYEETVRVVKLDIDESPAMAQKYGVKGVPTLLLFADGQITPFHGARTRSALAAFLDEAVERAQ